MMHAPSSSPPRTIGRRRWLTCALKAETGSGPVAPIGTAPPPLWRAIDSRIIARNSCSFIDRDRIDNRDDRGVDRSRFLAERFARRPSFEDNQDLFVDARADTVDRQQRGAAWGGVGVQRLHQHQFRALELAV